MFTIIHYLPPLILKLLDSKNMLRVYKNLLDKRIKLNVLLSYSTKGTMNHEGSHGQIHR